VQPEAEEADGQDAPPSKRVRMGMVVSGCGCRCCCCCWQHADSRVAQSAALCSGADSCRCHESCGLLTLMWCLLQGPGRPKKVQPDEEADGEQAPPVKRVRLSTSVLLAAGPAKGLCRHWSCNLACCFCWGLVTAATSFELEPVRPKHCVCCCLQGRGRPKQVQPAAEEADGDQAPPFKRVRTCIHAADIRVMQLC
jgi:hypothetical protein